jgi:transposase InsO family protein
MPKSGKSSDFFTISYHRNHFASGLYTSPQAIFPQPFEDLSLVKHFRGAPCHSQTQGKIERYHRSIENVITLYNYYFPGELKKTVSDFVQYYNTQRYHESLNNLKPAHVFYGRSKEIISVRKIIK